MPLVGTDTHSKRACAIAMVLDVIFKFKDSCKELQIANVTTKLHCKQNLNNYMYNVYAPWSLQILGQ